MGLYINLTVNFKGIADKDWEAAWKESMDIFKRFPLPLSRHTIETEKGKKRHVYSRNLVLNKGKKDEESLQSLMKKHAKMYNEKTVEEYLKGIYNYSFEAGFGVSEKGWATIDKLTDLEILKYLFALATVDNNEITFWRWRKHIFETPETWQYFKA